MCTAVVQKSVHGAYNLDSSYFNSSLMRQRVSVTVTLEDLFKGDEALLSEIPKNLQEELIAFQKQRMHLVGIGPGGTVNLSGTTGRGIYIGDTYIKGSGSPVLAVNNFLSPSEYTPPWNYEILKSPFLHLEQSYRVIGALKHDLAVLEFLHCALMLEGFIKRTGINSLDALIASGHPIPIAVGDNIEATEYIHKQVRAYSAKTNTDIPNEVFDKYGCVLIEFPGYQGRKNEGQFIALYSGEKKELDSLSETLFSAACYYRIMLDSGMGLASDSAHYQNISNTSGFLRSIFVDYMDFCPLAYKISLICEELDLSGDHRIIARHMVCSSIESILYDYLTALNINDKAQGMHHYLPAMGAFFNGLSNRAKEDRYGHMVAKLALEAVDGIGGCDSGNFFYRSAVILPFVIKLLKEIPAVAAFSEARIEKFLNTAKRYGCDPSSHYLIDSNEIDEECRFRADVVQEITDLYWYAAKKIESEFVDPAGKEEDFGAAWVNSSFRPFAEYQELSKYFKKEFEANSSSPTDRYLLRRLVSSLAINNTLLTETEWAQFETRVNDREIADEPYPALVALSEICVERLKRMEQQKILNYCWPYHPHNKIKLIEGIEGDSFSLVDLYELYECRKPVSSLLSHDNFLNKCSLEKFISTCETVLSSTKDPKLFSTDDIFQMTNARLDSDLLGYPAPICEVWGHLNIINNPSHSWVWALHLKDLRDRQMPDKPLVAWRISHTKKNATFLCESLAKMNEVVERLEKAKESLV